MVGPMYRVGARAVFALQTGLSGTVSERPSSTAALAQAPAFTERSEGRMLTIEEAFRKFKSRLELNDREQKNASCRHQEIREHLRGRFAVDDDFLTGSYRRYTKTKPLKDVDIFCVLSSTESGYRSAHPSKVLKVFEQALAEKY